MIPTKTLQHFNDIASSWEQKEWVNSDALNHRISHFVKQSERHAENHQKGSKSSLYLGIGTGVLFKYLKRYNIAGVDAAAGMLKQCPEGIIQILSKVEDLPFLMDDQFHLSFSRNLLKHCEDPAQAVASMYKKIRKGSVAVSAESIVFQEKDSVVPTTLVRTTDPSHPSFLSLDATLNLFRQAGFKDVYYEIIPHRSAWLKRWIAAENASSAVHEEMIRFYKNTPQSFKELYNVHITDDEITSTVPWLMVRAKK